MAAVLGGQLLEGGQHVVDHHAALVAAVAPVAGDAHRGPLLQRLRHEGVAVEVLPLEGEKEASRRELPRVGGHRARAQVRVVEFLYHRFSLIPNSWVVGAWGMEVSKVGVRL